MRLTAFLTLLFTLLFTCGRAQDASFQQKADFIIDAKLDDERHELHAHLKLTYTNNSPDSISVIPFHFWPKAYSSDETEFAQQQLRNGKTDFHFSEQRQRGTLDSLKFVVNGTAAEHKFRRDAPDVADVLLPGAIPPGGSAVIETPFRVKIPASFSRLGHVGQSYQITQWYPKPAVYDKNGWHPMPYLDQGEFYSEFGNFTLHLTLPENYVVGATGVLQNPDERNWLLKKAEADRVHLNISKAAGELSDGFVRETFPTSSERTKTLTWQAEQVHDFAWFADKRFRVLHDTLQLAEREDAIHVWSMFTATEAGLWVKSTDYIKRATRFYSEQVGTYPYPQVTGVQSALSAGGGMEYPMITVIGRSGSAAGLDRVLAHEIGHNWFYGILASNERAHPWMDEGLNSFYEHRYMAKFWPDRPAGIELANLQIDYDRLGYHYLARQGKDQAPDTRSDSLSQYNYWLQAYSKPALALKELEAHAGTEAFDRAMRAYYADWKFRHPQPDDFFSTINESLGLETEPWFREAFTTTKTSNWNRGAAPGFVAYHKGDRMVPQPEGEKSNALDLYPKGGMSQGRKFSLGVLTNQENPNKRQIFASPIAAFNEHDGPMIGATLHNRTLEPRRLEWMLAPLYGFESKTLNGFAGIRLRVPRSSGGIEQSTLSAGVQRFSDFTLRRTDTPYSYFRYALKAETTFRHAPITETESKLNFRMVLLQKDRPEFSATGEIAGKDAEGEYFWRLGYSRAKTREITPIAFSLNLEAKVVDEATPFRAGHLKLEGIVNGGYQYEQERFLRYRLFGGVFLANELRESAVRSNSGFSLVDNAFSDYRYDDLYLGRNLDGIYGQQLEQRQGGFRAPISSAFAFGTSNSYMTAINIDADLPAFPAYLPFGLFLDAGYYGFKSLSADPLSGEFSWVGGVSLSAMKGRIGVFAPLIADPDTKMLLEQQGDLINRLTFRLSLSGWMPWRWVDDLF
ncbi:M1 family metallopeptidase [Neolewinella aurantiaca]|uniref:M1 family metallopeptidase n=1 Tax=Neolewinella aurantiaca TaxID=2602767 RepID=A0A5C7FE31_9BACT|nr:M1 family metallopeptidase [Neolewinella aurantiaca]TXF88498.1 M1 family metallopeptidase [Neolewinella aurantiaca]